MLISIIIALAHIVAINCQISEGDYCSFDDGTPGVCRIIDRCDYVYQQSQSGIMPEKLCGYTDYEPVVCCPGRATERPINTQRTTVSDRQRPIYTTPERTTQTPYYTRKTTRDPYYTPRPTPPTRRPIYTQRTTTEDDRPIWGGVTVGGNMGVTTRGAIAKRMCGEYAKSVYTLEIPPTLAGNRHPVNKSLCAIKSRTLITGGTKADPKEFPHMVAVGFDGGSRGKQWMCGGTLVSDRFVLTAAHCLYSRDLGNAVYARIGDLNLLTRDDDARPQERRIVERIRHPEYKRPAEYNDIALLKLDSPVKFDAYVRPACLSTQPNFFSRSAEPKAVATGWGRVDWADDEGSSDLLKVTLKLVEGRTCNRSFIDSPDDRLKYGIVDQSQICAGEVGKDTCQGDSGGPLAVYSPEQFYCMYDVIGVTSLGRLCGSTSPGIYTRVYNYIPWLEQTIWPDQYKSYDY